MRPLHVEVDFDLVVADAKTGRGIDDVEVRARDQLRQPVLRRKCVGITLNRKRTTPVYDRDGLARTVVSLVVQAGEIVCRLNRRRLVSATVAGQALHIQLVARVGADRQLAVIVGRKRLRLRAGETLRRKDIGWPPRVRRAR